MSSKNRHDTRTTLGLGRRLRCRLRLRLRRRRALEHVVTVRGDAVVPSSNHTTAKTDLPLYSSFVYGDQSSSSTGSQIYLSVAGLGDVFFGFVSKNRFCVWTNLWVSLSFSSGSWGVSGYRLSQY